MNSIFTDSSFADETSLHPHLRACLNDAGFLQETVVQKNAIPAIMSGNDVLVKSETGSGKTLAYAIPLVQSLQSYEPKVTRNDGIHAVIILPTRELVEQTFSVVQKLLKPFIRLVPGCLTGGEKPKSEKARLRKGVTILITTPGRLTYHVESTACIDFARIRFVIIDEADRMLEMGFANALQRIGTKIRDDCKQKFQTVLLSATLTSGVTKLSGMSISKKLVRIDGGTTTTSDNNSPNTDSYTVDMRDTEFTLPERLKQFYCLVPMKQRLVALAAFLLDKCRYPSSGKAAKVLVFLPTNASVEFHHHLLLSTLNDGPTADDGHELKLYMLWGDMPQVDRKAVFHKFSEGKSSGILLATDVACRGLDLPRMDWVVQYAPPTLLADYVHRVGRTARIGAAGEALLFLAPSESGYVSSTLAALGIRPKPVELASLARAAQLEAAGAERRKGSRGADEALSYLQWRFQRAVEDDAELAHHARQGYHTFVQFYTTYPASLRSHFDSRELHLGHVAKAHALREPPSTIARNIAHSRRVQLLRREKRERKIKQKLARTHFTEPSEFDAGLARRSASRVPSHGTTEFGDTGRRAPHRQLTSEEASGTGLSSQLTEAIRHRPTAHIPKTNEFHSRRGKQTERFDFAPVVKSNAPRGVKKRLPRQQADGKEIAAKRKKTDHYDSPPLNGVQQQTGKKKQSVKQLSRKNASPKRQRDLSNFFNAPAPFASTRSRPNPNLVNNLTPLASVSEFASGI